MQRFDYLKIRSAYVRAKHRLFFLDLDGTLSPLFDVRQSIALSGKIMRTLESLVQDPNNQVMIISGRSREDLDAVIGGMPLVLVAEHGGFYREPTGKWKARFPATALWKNRMLGAVEALTRQYAGSSIEEKYYSICWHYRLIKNSVHDIDIDNILSILRKISNRNEFYFEHDKFTLEVRTVGIDKGTFAAQWMWGQRPFDFILAMGDGKTDEDLFEAVGNDHFTVRIGGPTKSNARFRLRKQDEVETLLSGLISPLSTRFDETG